MPTYQYVCEKCGHEFELFQSMASDPLELCPKEHCPRKRWAKGKVRRMIGSGAGLIFKGSGFYITDYRSESYQKAAKKEKEAGSKTESSKKSDGGGTTPKKPETASSSSSSSPSK